MAAYWVARSKINDAVEYKKYTDRVPGILKKFGGKVLARGGRFKILEGPEKFQRFVVIEFPSLEQAVACHDSPEYREAAAFRRLVEHLRERSDVQNIDLMELAGFCRNCLSRWYREAAEERGLDLTDPQAREIVYGMRYDEWKSRHQT